MRLYIVRHGKAERASPTGADRDRALRPRGERQALWLGERVATRTSVSDRPALILTSGYTRAMDTARLIGGAIGCPVRREASLEFGPVEAVVELVAAVRDGATAAIMLVGHNPQLEEVIAALAPGAPPEARRLRTGQAVVLDGEPPRVVEVLRLDEDDDE